MPDETFEIKGVSKTSAAHAMKLAVLWPVIGRRSLKDKDVIFDMQILHQRWRKRAEVLRLKNWLDLSRPGALQFARNCPPACVKAFGPRALRPCKLAPVCPFCYMRHVGRVFNKFAHLLPGRGKLATGITLVEIAGQRTIRRAEAGKYLSPHLHEWVDAPKGVLRRIKALGAYRSITLDPKVVEGHRSGYRLTYRILAVVPTGWAPPDWLDNGRRKIRLTTVRSKKELINPIGRTCRYPVGLLRGDPTMTVISLNARRGKRLSEFVGQLRGTERGDASE